ncbi:oxidoreductase [Halomonas sp. TRM85114]|uniref:oxidoreductase n=1 Tax=Halomonas jincaotanensis TaxID=2810616 RepID=UPI001BD4091D|nr:oxidoreductase [Halomonas jincaotanensis]MBS9402778.1 oxidoreductase [Halomonas jincaotanensis]
MPRRIMPGLSVVLLIGSLLFSMRLVAEPLPSPTGEVILTISGNIAHTNAGAQAHLDRDMLMALESRVVETNTPWHSDSSRYEGPLLLAVLQVAGAEGERIVVRALNDFEAEIPITDLHDYKVILALHRDGEPMPIREFGPLFVLYPFDEHPELNNETIRFRSVWQVEKIHVP